MKSGLIVSSLLSLGSAAYLPSFQTTVPAAPSNQPSIAQWNYTGSAFDGPKLSPVNATSYDWWYFDAVSPDGVSTLTFTFFTSTAAAFPFLGNMSQVTNMYVWATFPNGTLWYNQINATDAVILTTGDGASGTWTGSGGSFIGSSDMKTYSVSINTPLIKGNLGLKSIAPAHPPCGTTLTKGASLTLAPSIGWANAVPDADATVDVTILGTQLKFNGIGYHDKNWSDVPFFKAVGSWYWGHARLGPYSIVWLDYLNKSATEYVSGFVSRAGKILTSSCTPGNTKIRPYGGTSGFPPNAGQSMANGFNISMTLADGTPLSASVAVKGVGAAIAPIYGRYSGPISGRVGNASYTGVAMFEEFKLFGLPTQ